MEVVAAIIERQDGAVLVGRRAPGRTSAGLWEFPGGKVEPGEDSATALEREVFEELGTVVECGALLDRSTTAVGAIDVDLACFRASVVGTQPRVSTDHDELRWVRPQQLLELEWAAPDLPAVALLAGTPPERGQDPDDQPSPKC